MQHAMTVTIDAHYVYHDPDISYSSKCKYGVPAISVSICQIRHAPQVLFAILAVVRHSASLPQTLTVVQGNKQRCFDMRNLIGMLG